MAEKYRAARTGDWFQDRPRLENTFLEDHALQSMLRRLLPSDVAGATLGDLQRFGGRCAGELADAARECELQQPELEQYNGWGERVDNVRTGEAWRSMKAVCAEEGLIAAGYRREHGEHSRVVQAVKLMLFAPSSGLYSCPLAMTDGAAKLLEGILRGAGGQRFPVSDGARQNLELAFDRLTSRDPACFATSGQWMTERRGGSDVANGTDTYAVPELPANERDPAEEMWSTHQLFGYKWFTSATDADMAITLARPSAPGSPAPGPVNGSLAAYFLWTRGKASGKLNGLTVEKLKKKLGTKQLPTGELLLDGARATQLCEAGQGIPQIMILANITRLHNSISAAAGMRRMVQLCRDYSCRRLVFDRPLSLDALHIHTLARLEVETRGAQALVLEVASLLGRTEVPRSREDARSAADLLRILTPLAKLLTGKMAVDVASEGLEAFGGAGYLEDTGIPAMLRDAQVLPIWEGTTNVNALDVFRSVQRSGGKTLQVLLDDARTRLAKVAAALGADSAIDGVLWALAVCERFALAHIAASGAGAATGSILARDFAMLLGRSAVALLLLEHAAWEGATEGAAVAARRWAATLEQHGWLAALDLATSAAAGVTAAAVQKSSAMLADPACSAILAPAVASGTPERGASVRAPDRLHREDLVLVFEGWPWAPAAVAQLLATSSAAPRSSL
mmetsp:Transcript_57977/g.188630  ORF Transcript_57977/g.188630 Transcript_57977/m.188630 type:complete len:681 (-) Transcript_57977:49-2091(-)